MEGRLQKGKPSAGVFFTLRWKNEEGGEELFLVSSLLGQCHQLSFPQFLWAGSLGVQRGPKGSRPWLEIALCSLAAAGGAEMERRGQGAVLPVTAASCF